MSGIIVHMNGATNMTQRWMVNVCPILHFDNARTHTYEHNISIIAWNVKSVLDYLETDESHKFTLGQVTLLEGFRRLFPNYWDLLHRRVLEGRIEIVGGSYVMSDLTIPDGESIIRQFLYGLKFSRSELGVDVRTGWGIDSSSHCAQLPQILRQCGIDSYFFYRGMPYAGPSEFVWRGPDGSRVNAIWLSKGYDCMAWLSENVREAFTAMMTVLEQIGSNAVSHNLFLPVGGELVPPSPHLADIVSRWNETFPDMRSVIVTANEFVDKLKTVEANLPIVTGSLDAGRFTSIRSGGLSSRVKLKQKNRTLETLLYLVELYLSIGGDHTKTDELDNIWRMMLFNQDHNIIRGTISDEPYQLALRRYQTAIKKAERLLENAIASHSSKIKREQENTSFVVYNPVPWRRHGIVRIPVDISRFTQPYFEIRSPNGDSVPYQVVNESPEVGLYDIVIAANDMPSLGHRMYSVVPVDERPEFESSLRSGKNWMESEGFVVEFDDFNGSISRLYDKKTQFEILNKSGNYLTFQSDVGDLYRFSASNLSDESTIESSLRFSSKPMIIEAGPVRTIMELKTNGADADIVQRITVYDKIHRIDLETHIDYKGQDKRVQLNFPLSILTENVVVGSQFCAEKKSTQVTPSSWNEEEMDTKSALDWIDCNGADRSLCVALQGLHEFKYIDGNLMITLLRSVDHLSRGKDDDVLLTELAREKGKYEFKLSLIPHRDSWKTDSIWQSAQEHRIGLIGYPLEDSEGTIDEEQELIRIDGIKLNLSCFKPSDRDNVFILRFYEPEGNSGDSTIRFHRKIKNVTLVDLTERDIGEIAFNENSLELSVDAHSIITLKIQFEE